MASAIEYAWAAGLIEGEGCFTIHSKRHPYFLMDMTDKDVLERFHAIFPGSTLRGPYFHRNRPQHKPRYRVDAFGAECLFIIDKVKPYLGNRRSERVNEICDITKGGFYGS